MRRAPSGCAASTTRWSVAQPRPPVQSRPSLPAAPGRESRRTLPRERGSSSTRSTWKLRVDLRAECRVHRTPNMPVYTAATSHGNKNPDMLGAPVPRSSIRFLQRVVPVRSPVNSTATWRASPPRACHLGAKPYASGPDVGRCTSHAPHACVTRLAQAPPFVCLPRRREGEEDRRPRDCRVAQPLCLALSYRDGFEPSHPPKVLCG